MDSEDHVRRETRRATTTGGTTQEEETEVSFLPGHEQPVKIFPFGVNKSRLDVAARREKRVIQIVDDFRGSDLFLTTLPHYRRKPQRVRDAESLGIPVYVLKSNDISQLRLCLHSLSSGLSRTSYVQELQETLSSKKGKNKGDAQTRDSVAQEAA